MSLEEQRSELRRFLKDRRARISPGDVGLPKTGRRRVPGLRREEVASLAGIGVSWYTALENGEADGVSESTLAAIAGALRLSDSERQYLLALAGRLRPTEGPERPGRLLVETVHAMPLPAYIISANWEIVECNEAFRRVWGIAEPELPFNAVERLFLHPVARKMHGARFIENITPVVAMVHSAVGRRPSAALRGLRDRLLADSETRKIWEDYQIAGPLTVTSVEIESAIGTFCYQTVNLQIPDTLLAVVVQVPDAESQRRLLS